MKKSLHYSYDKEADVFYFSSGVLKSTDTTVEAGDDVLLRLDPKTKQVWGFTLINASNRLSSKRRDNTLPFSLVQTA